MYSEEEAKEALEKAVKNIDFDLNKKIVFEHCYQENDAYHVRRLAKNVKEICKEAEKAIIDVKDLDSANGFIIDNPEWDISNIQNLILSEKDASSAYHLAILRRPKTDFKSLEDVIVESKDAYYAMLFAKDIPEANIERLKKVVIEKKDCIYICYFASDVKPLSNVQDLADVVYASKNKAHIEWFLGVVDHSKFDAIPFILESSVFS